MFELYPYQKKAVQSVYDYFDRGNKGNPLIVAPTGSGKSLIIAEFVKGVHQAWPAHKTLILSHVEELIEQNAQKIIRQWPSAPLGVYHAGLRARHIGRPITVAGVQSIYNKVHTWGHIDLIIIDEAHMLSPNNDSMYRQLIAKAYANNPHLKVLGLSATPYRYGSGCLIAGKNSLFTDFCYKIELRELIEGNYLSPLICLKADGSVDVSNLHIKRGDYDEKDMQAKMNKPELIKAAIKEVLANAKDRKKWLFFCSGVEHAGAVCDELNDLGIKAACITAKTPKAERAAAIEGLRSGDLQAITNNTVLTTGTDIPGIDLLVLLRATKSPVLYVQMLGRGMRKHPEKANCLVMDFAGNVDEHGPIADIKIATPTGSSNARGEKKPPLKICEACETENHINRKSCSACGAPFPENDGLKHDVVAAADRNIMFGPHKFSLPIEAVEYSAHSSYKTGNITLKASYHGAGKIIHEYFSPASDRPLAKSIFRNWWLRKFPDWFGDVPGSVDDALSFLNDKDIQIRNPAEILVTKSDDKERIIDYVYKN